MVKSWRVTIAALLVAVAACSNAPLTSDAQPADPDPQPTAVGSGPETTDAADPGGSEPGTTGTDAAGDGSDAFVSVDAPGVSDTEIRIGAVTSQANPAGLPLSETVPGFKAYLERVNEAGGVHGRELVLAVERDDGTLENDLTITQLVTQDDVFAAAPVAPVLFTGAPELVEKGVPTFGWNSSTEFQDAPNLYGFRGYLCFECPIPAMPWLFQEIERTKVGVLALAGIPQTQACADQVKGALAKFGGSEIVFFDPDIKLGETNFAPQISQMAEAGVDMLANCLDANAVLAVGEEMLKQRLDAVQLLVIGYDPSVIEAYGDELEGSWAMTTFTPFEVEPAPPGLAAFLEAMESSGGPLNEYSLAGWVAGDLLVKGLEAAGPNFSRQSVIEAINAMTDYDADGIVTRQDWSVIHNGPPPQSCVVFSEVVGGVLEPRFGEPGKPFSCFDTNATEMPSAPIASAG